MADNIDCERQRLASYDSPQSPADRTIFGAREPRKNVEKRLDKLLENSVEDINLSRRYQEFRGFLDSQAEDWQVWT